MTSPLGLVIFSDVVIATIVAVALYCGLHWFSIRYEAGHDRALMILIGIFGAEQDGSLEF